MRSASVAAIWHYIRTGQLIQVSWWFWEKRILMNPCAGRVLTWNTRKNDRQEYPAIPGSDADRKPGGYHASCDPHIRRSRLHSGRRHPYFKGSFESSGNSKTAVSASQVQ